MTRTVWTLILAISMHLATQTSSAPAASSNPNVRAITGFVRLDHAKYQKQIADALVGSVANSCIENKAPCGFLLLVTPFGPKTQFA
jgi:hypothetical protein